MRTNTECSATLAAAGCMASVSTSRAPISLRPKTLSFQSAHVLAEALKNRKESTATSYQAAEDCGDELPDVSE